MCLAHPGKIIKIKNKENALVDFHGIKKEINISLVQNVKEKEYVIVHAGFAIQKLNQTEADEIFNLVK